MLASPQTLPQQLQVWATALVHRRVVVSSLVSLPDRCVLSIRWVIVVARWECSRGLTLGLSPVTGSLACVFFSPLFVIQIMSVSAVYLDILGG